MRYLSSTSPSCLSRPGKLFALGAAAALCVLAASSASAAPTLINGAMEGPLANATPPPGWTATTVFFPGTGATVPTSPDTIDQNHQAFGGTYLATPSASPNGGTFVGLAQTDFNPAMNLVANEGIRQTVSGFTIGTSYTLSWFHANFGAGGAACSPGCGADNAIELFADGESVGSGSVLSVGAGWFEDSVTFIAKEADIDLTFQSLYAAGHAYSYQQMDGVRLTETPVIPPPNAVPEPAALSLFSGAGLAMLLASRRRKQAKQAAA